MGTDPAARRAALRAGRLLRWYPGAWRARYGEEFAELLICDIAERPRSWTRDVDVVRGGIAARLAARGLCGCTLDSSEQVSTSLVALAWCVAAFLGFGAALWSQLTIGWQWSSPSTATVVATVVTSVAMAAFVVLAVLAAGPVAWVVVSRVVRGQWRGLGLGGPLVVFVVAAVLLFAGGRHFGNGWPGTGGHPWSGLGLVPGGVAAFSWASTLFVSAYWAHPAALAAFPVAEFAWMAMSPLAVLGVVGSAAAVVRRAGLPPRVLAFEVRLGITACLVMAVFLAGCCVWISRAWISRGGPGSGPFHAGAVDVGAAVVMAIALAVARQAARVARSGCAGPVGGSL
jgi:hypothetical protein